MAHIVADRVLESTTTTGTGALTLSAAITGFRRFSAVCAIGDTVPYFIEAVDSLGQPTGDYEYGIGTYTSANELTRTTVHGSSNSGSAVDLAAGAKNVGIAFTENEYSTIKEDIADLRSDFDAGALTAGTPTNASGTSVSFTSIPSGTKRITVPFSGLSTNGTSLPIVQIGDSGGIETAGYAGAASIVADGSNAVTAAFTTGFGITGSVAASSQMSGAMVLTLLDASTNTWVASVGGGMSSGALQTFHGGGTKSLSGELTQLRITTVGGSNTFDGGTVNILFE
jgi:hypothetical protein